MYPKLTKCQKPFYECIDIFTTTMKGTIIIPNAETNKWRFQIKSPEVIQLVSGQSYSSNPKNYSSNPRVPVFSQGAIVTVPQPPYPSPARAVSLSQAPDTPSKQALTCPLPAPRVTSARLPLFQTGYSTFPVRGPSVFLS